MQEMICDEAREAAALLLTTSHCCGNLLLHDDLHGLPQPEGMVTAENFHGLAPNAHIIENGLLQDTPFLLLLSSDQAQHMMKAVNPQVNSAFFVIRCV